MKFLFYLGHPAHYLNVSVVIHQLSCKGHEILLVARDKDVLFDLIKDIPYEAIYLKKRKGRSKLALIGTILRREVALFWIARRWKPDLMIGTDIVITHIGKVMNIPTVILNEDDASEIPFFTKYGIKYTSHVLSPHCCDNAPYNHKKVGYSGYHELAYLHPIHFTLRREKADALFGEHPRYFILRFSALASHHDVGKTGITDDIASELIALLEPYGRVHITSERELATQFEPYRMRIDPRDMHHALAFAHMYIGDSQTMTAEAAVLGTPAVRFNDFVGRLSYLEELEHTYQLTYGVKTSEPRKLFEVITRLLAMPDLKKVWQARREHMLAQTIDVAAFFTWYFENYPLTLQAVGEQMGRFEYVSQA